METNASTRQWTMLGNTGVAETLENVGSNESRQWLVQYPDSWSADKLGKLGQSSPGEIKWRGDGKNGESALVYRGTKSELQQFLEQHSGALFAEEDEVVQAIGLRGAERRLEEQRFSNNRLGVLTASMHEHHRLTMAMTLMVTAMVPTCMFWTLASGQHMLTSVAVLCLHWKLFHTRLLLATQETRAALMTSMAMARIVQVLLREPSTVWQKRRGSMQ